MFQILQYLSIKIPDLNKVKVAFPPQSYKYLILVSAEYSSSHGRLQSEDLRLPWSGKPSKQTHVLDCTKQTDKQNQWLNNFNQKLPNALISKEKKKILWLYRFVTMSNLSINKACFTSTKALQNIHNLSSYCIFKQIYFLSNFCN